MAILPWVVVASGLHAVASTQLKPNFVFLLGESTDGRLFRPDSPVPLPNIRKLQQQGAVLFDETVANAPVCCPSRSSFLSGRYPHKINHTHNGIEVRGVWNNYEGLPADYNATVFDILTQAGGYTVNLAGKTDWTVGGHSESCFLEAFTHNVAFPYNISLDGGWNQEDAVCASCRSDAECISPGGTNGPHGSAYPAEWHTLNNSIAWIKQAAASGKPFMAYQGFNIVHPPYATNEYWYSSISPGNVTVPVLPAYEEMHPCDLQASMLKGCTPAAANASAFDDPARLARVRRIYYAEVAEFDAMVGEYMKAVQDAGVLNNTIFVVAADHGDMQLEHRQFYKMVAYEGSVHVPLLIAGPGIVTQTVTQPTQLLDLFPTILELAGLKSSIPSYVDGYSLVPFLQGSSVDPSRPDWVMAQFHGDDISASWFLLRQGSYKYIAWGLGPGAEYPGYPGVTMTPQLFHLDTDPDELVDLWTPTHPVARDMEQTLRQAIDYPAVALDVAQYQLDMFHWWTSANAGTWEAQLSDPSAVRWATAWQANPQRALQAVKTWMNAPVAIQPCRNATVSA